MHDISCMKTYNNYTDQTLIKYACCYNRLPILIPYYLVDAGTVVRILILFGYHLFYIHSLVYLKIADNNYTSCIKIIRLHIVFAGGNGCGLLFIYIPSKQRLIIVYFLAAATDFTINLESQRCYADQILHCDQVHDFQYAALQQFGRCLKCPYILTRYARIYS